MPNGGSDCCGTCWFNSKNKGVPGYHGSKEEGEVHCTIRDLQIEDPFYTYCANHPHHNKERIELPLGPVYVNDGYPYSRKLWMHPPDTEAIRLKLIGLLATFDTRQAFRYPSPTDIEEEVIKQLSALKEKRAIPELKRLIRLNLDDYRNPSGPLLRNKAVIVGQAIEALLLISVGEALPEVADFIRLGLDDEAEKSYEEEADNFAVIRYHLVRGLQYANTSLARALLTLAQDDPHREVSAFAAEMLLRNKI